MKKSFSVAVRRARPQFLRSMPWATIARGGVWSLMLVSGLAYILQMNVLSTTGYHIRQLENELAQTRKETRDLELKALALQSMSSVQDRLNQVALVEIERPEFLEASAVALAR